MSYKERYLQDHKFESKVKKVLSIICALAGLIAWGYGIRYIYTDMYAGLLIAFIGALLFCKVASEREWYTYIDEEDE